MQYDFTGQLMDAPVRASGVALIAFVGLAIFRVRSAAVRHAVWTVAVTGMLLQVPLAMVVPPIAIAALPDRPREATKVGPRSSVPHAAAPARPSPPEPARERVSLGAIFRTVYCGVALLLFLRMAIGFRALSRILQQARPVPELGPGVFESKWLPAPGSVGWLRPNILLPEGWREWDGLKRRAVLAHESAHLRRRDWPIRVVAEVNTCLFWFHPLAWWMQRELDRLAEEACDDAAISETNARERYAAVLVEIARGVHHRLDYRAVFMARDSAVARRLDRILARDYVAAEPLGRLGRGLLVTFGIAVIYLSAAAGLAAPQAKLDTAIRILIDNSGSMQDKTERAKAIALALVNGLGPDAGISIVHFDDEVFGGTKGFTRDREAPRAALSRIDSRGGKAMRDAVRASIDDFASVREDRKAIVLITEGFDTSSKATVEELLATVRASGVRVFSIGLLSDDPARANEATSVLRRMAEASGGLALFPHRLESSGAIATEILRNAFPRR